MTGIRQILVLLAASVGADTPALAQTCRPYWAYTGTPSQAFSQDHAISAASFDDGTGPTVWMLWGNGTLHVYRLQGAQWNICEAGLPSYTTLYGVKVLDDQSGSHLFLFGVTFDPPTHAYDYWTAEWNGATWSVVWPGFANDHASPTVSLDLGGGPGIYGFVASTPAGSLYPARWDGSQWITIGVAPGIGANDLELVAYDDGSGRSLHVIGDFSSIGGVPAHGFAKWDGQTWVPLGDQDAISTPRRAVVYDDGNGPAVYFLGARVYGLSYVGPLSRWNGREWSLAGAMSGGTVASDAFLFDDGRGPALYVAGAFTGFGGIPTHSIARYDGHWEALGDGILDNSAQIDHVATMNGPRGPTLFTFGFFNRAGAGLSPKAAQWVGCPNCYANCDLSTTAPALNVNDFVCFLQKFAAHLPEANCDVNATIDVNDFVCFLQKFAAGCG
jgi:hypothetical protein